MAEGSPRGEKMEKKGIERGRKEKKGGSRTPAPFSPNPPRNPRPKEAAKKPSRKDRDKGRKKKKVEKLEHLIPLSPSWSLPAPVS